jgi:hypothetical protein
MSAALTRDTTRTGDNLSHWRGSRLDRRVKWLRPPPLSTSLGWRRAASRRAAGGKGPSVAPLSRPPDRPAKRGGGPCFINTLRTF